MAVLLMTRLREAVSSFRRRLTVDDYILIGILLAACLAGFVHLTRLQVIENEGAEYATIAMNLDRGVGYVGLHGTPEVYFPPAFPFSIYIIARVVGDLALSGRIAAMLFGTITALMAGLLAGRWYGRRVGLLAAVLTLSAPLMLGTSTAVLSETTYMACSLAGILLIWEAFERKSGFGFAAAGAVMGLAHLTKPEVMIYASLLILLRFLFARGFRGMLAVRIPFFFVLYFVVIAPHVAFLHQHTGKWMLEGKSGLNTSIALRTAAGEPLDNACRILGSETVPAGLLLHPMDEVSKRSAAQQLLPRPFALWINVVRNVFPLVRAMTHTFGYLFLLLAAVGFFTVLRQSRERFLFLTLAAGIPLLLVSSFWIFNRYVVVVLPVFAIAAAVGLSAIATWAAKLVPRIASRGGFTGVLAVGVVAVTLTLWPRVSGPRSAFTQSHQREWKMVGEWLHQHGAHGKRIMSLSTAVPYYADAQWVTLPLGPPDRVLAYGVEQGAGFIVMREDEWLTGFLADSSRAGALPWTVIYRERLNPYNPLIVLGRAGEETPR
jgi:4-amino-4-deoxy-L-arabinose transferase-like glycosyltransferase